MKPRSIRKEITVAATQERSFRFFTENITDWWPKEHHIGSAPAVREIIEPRVGGRWYSLNVDGSETSVGKVLVWEPFGRLVLSWQITAQWESDPRFETEVEIGFSSADGKSTTVTLEHRQLERFGPKAAEMQGMFDSENGWTKTLRSYAEALLASTSTVEARP
jgi:uncharacterized protein YndB with AHSA1/START domain